MTRKSLFMSLSALVICAGFGLKLARYTGAVSNETAAFDAATATLASRGWTPAGEAETRAGMYVRMAFERDGCATPIVVGILGGFAEGAELVRRDFDNDVAFIQSGEVVAWPSSLRRQTDVLLHGLKSAAGLPSRPVLPVLAVSPAPADDRDDCRGPPAETWRH